MFALKRVKTGEIYRNYLKSVSQYDVILKCFMSSNSKNIDDVLNVMHKKKSHPYKEKEKAAMKTAHKLFDLIKGDDNLKKGEADEKVETEKMETENVTSKLNDLIKTATTVPQTSAPTLEITKAVKAPKKAVTDDSKQEFLEKAKQVAIALGVDVETTQTELFEAFENKKGSAKVAHEKFGKTYKGRYQDKNQKESIYRDVETSGLNIFTENVGEQETRPTLETWNRLKEITLLETSFRPPRNYFDELINWTLQGKLWHFPIDNDQDWKEELATDFTEHIFLDKHLEPWCPKMGPIRHFMELVTTGLSKNPYLSVEKKKQHIFWYRDYFESKSKILAELGVLDSKITSGGEMLEAGDNKS